MSILLSDYITGALPQGANKLPGKLKQSEPPLSQLRGIKRKYAGKNLAHLEGEQIQQSAFRLTELKTRK